MIRTLQPPAAAAAPAARRDASAQQSRSMQRLAGICLAYVAAFAGALVAWLMLRGHPPSLWLVGPGVLVPAFVGVIGWRRHASARRHAMNLIAATLALPIVLMFWAASFDDEPAANGAAAAEAAAARLDTTLLFAGAAAVQGSDQRLDGLPLLRAASFADGSELRVTHHADAGTAARQIDALAQALQGVPFDDAGRHGIRLQGVSTGGTFILLEQHGSEVLEIRARNVQTGLARLAAQGVPPPAPPVERPADGTASAEPAWPFIAAAAVVHGLCFAGLIVWCAAAITGVPPEAGTEGVEGGELLQRLQSAAAQSPHCDWRRTAADTVQVTYRMSARRVHHIRMRLDAAKQRVLVVEKLGVDGDAPCDASEARMHDLGDVGESAFDASRPDAQRVWSSTWQATMIEPHRLAAVPLQLLAARAQFPAAYLASLDGEGVLTALCAVVTRSGWHWQPRLTGLG